VWCVCVYVCAVLRIMLSNEQDLKLNQQSYKSNAVHGPQSGPNDLSGQFPNLPRTHSYTRTHNINTLTANTHTFICIYIYVVCIYTHIYRAILRDVVQFIWVYRRQSLHVLLLCLVYSLCPFRWQCRMASTLRGSAPSPLCGPLSTVCIRRSHAHLCQNLIYNYCKFNL